MTLCGRHGRMMPETSMDQRAIDELADIFMRARQTGERLDALPARLAPKDFEESRAVMDAVDKLVGEPIVGTKIAAKPGEEVVYAPLPSGRVFMSPARVPRTLTPSKYMECEISFRLIRDLPPRREEYTQPEVFDALEACAAFELVDSRFRDLKSAMATTPYQFYADHIANGAMVFGAFRRDWQKFDFRNTRVSMKQGSRTIIEKTGGHPTGNPAMPAVVLANIRRATTGLKSGTFVVTGSFTGFHPVELNTPVIGEFDGFGTMEATIVG
jgi:2-keto-4-pentenoate hydratase